MSDYFNRNIQKEDMKDLLEEERPREKLEKRGPDALSDPELLAIVLRVGSKGNDVLSLSRQILRSLNLKDLSGASLNQLMKFPGVKKAKACQVIACFELARRLSISLVEKKQILNSRDVFEYLSPRISGEKKECFVGLYLDSKNRVLREERISIGTANASLVHPREVFAPALAEGAVSLIIAHNHPSGDPSPSAQDRKVTEVMEASGRTLGIEMLDHVIIGKNEYYSFREKK